MQTQSLDNGPPNLLAEFRKFAAMQLHKIQANIFDDIIDKVSFLVDENANDIRRCWPILNRVKQFPGLMRLDITRTLFIEHETNHVRSCFYSGMQVVGSAQSTYFSLHHSVCTLQD